MSEPTVLAPWESFYVIVGSSGAALTGLQFVVMALIAENEQMRGGAHEIATFGTPTVLHFGAVLLLSGLLSAPWPAVTGPAIALGMVGLSGAAYSVITWLRARRTQLYTPVLEDWIWHVILPLIAYVAILIASVQVVDHPTVPLFLVAGSSMLLLFIGIHNAWDTVTFVMLSMKTPRPNATVGHDPKEITES
jgi:hypothetical protein